MEEPVRDDAAHLKSLRLAADLDHAQLALMVNLSAAQVRQLEEDGDSLFYSPQIKAQSLRRVIRTLENASAQAAGHLGFGRLVVGAGPVAIQPPQQPSALRRMGGAHHRQSVARTANRHNRRSSCGGA